MANNNFSGFDWGNIGAGVGGIGGGLAGLFGLGKNKNPAEESNKYLDQIPGATNQYYQPYINSGMNAMNKLNGQYGQMTDDPNSLYNKLAGGYKESPGFQRKLQQAQTAGNNAYAAGGMAGTPAHGEFSAETASDIQGKDFEKYLNHMFGIYGAGQQGLQGMENQGYGAGTEYAKGLADIYGQKSRNAYEQAAGENAANSNDWSNIFSGIGSLLPLMAGLL